MGRNLEQALADLINKTTSTVDKSTNFLVDQAPDVIQQLLTWKLCSVGVSALMLLVVLFLVVLWNVRSIIKFNKDPYRHWAYRNDAEMIIFFIIPMISFVLSLCMFDYILEFLKIWLAPKIYLIEYAANLVSK